MASLLFALLFLQAAPYRPAPTGPVRAGAVEALPPLVRSIDLDAETLLADPSLLSSDTLALSLACGREAYYKLSERGSVLAAGKLLPGENGLRFARPGLFQRSQSLLLVLDLLEGGAPSRKFLRLQVTVDGLPEEGGREEELSGAFRLEMFHGGRLIGFRQKRMQELVKLTTGPVAPVADPLSGAAIRGGPPPGQSVSVLGLGMALAKYLAGKKAKKALQAQAGEMQKKRLSTAISRQEADGTKRDVPVIIELRTD